MRMVKVLSILIISLSYSSVWAAMTSRQHASTQPAQQARSATSQQQGATPRAPRVSRNSVGKSSLGTLEMEALKYSYLEQPIYPAAEVKKWGEHIALLAFNYNYQNYVDKFTNLSIYFTYNGWKRFLTFLWLSPDYSIEHLVAANLGVTSEFDGPTVIWARFPEEGRFTWEVLAPMTIHYAGPGVDIKRHINFILTISRVTTKIQRDGIAVIAVREVPSGVYPGLME